MLDMIIVVLDIVKPLWINFQKYCSLQKEENGYTKTKIYQALFRGIKHRVT